MNMHKKWKELRVITHSAWIQARKIIALQFQHQVDGGIIMYDRAQ